jgi:4-coumarate--CoA ligase
VCKTSTFSRPSSQSFLFCSFAGTLAGRFNCIRVIMPTQSPFPDVAIPDVDLWGLMFDRKDRDFADEKVIYRAIDSERKYTFADVKSLATLFGEGLQNQWDWQKDEILALYAPNDVDIGPIIYGTFFAGGIVTPANPGYSADELAYQLKNSGAHALATTKQFLPTALEAAQKVNIPSDRVYWVARKMEHIA